MAMCYVRTPTVHTSFEAKIMLILISVICSECKAPKNKMKQKHDTGHIISLTLFCRVFGAEHSTPNKNNTVATVPVPNPCGM